MVGAGAKPAGRRYQRVRAVPRVVLLATQDSRAAPLEPATKEKIVAALQAISDMLNVMERFYYRGVCAFDVIAAHNGVNTLLYILGFGVMGRDKMMERINKGDFSGRDTPEHI
jgi:hypothetical protein